MSDVQTANHRLQLTGCARVMMLLSAWSSLSAGGRQLSLLRYAFKMNRTLVPLDVAHQILATFGITKPSRAYERWVRDDGFYLDDFDEVLFDSPFIFVVDWRAALQDELKLIANALGLLDVQLTYDLHGIDLTDGAVSHADMSNPVHYVPNDDLPFSDVIYSVQGVIPPAIRFRAAPHNGLSDGDTFAVLPQDEWLDLDKLASSIIAHYFVPMPRQTA